MTLFLSVNWVPKAWRALLFYTLKLFISFNQPALTSLRNPSLVRFMDCLDVSHSGLLLVHRALTERRHFWANCKDKLEGFLSSKIASEVK